MRIEYNNKTLNLSTPVVMGILNLTPDSFFDGGKYQSGEKILKHVEKMIVEGASIIDLGACSSRPGSTPVSEEEERNRLSNYVSIIRKQFPQIFISIDTFRASIASQMLNEGADIINDISAGEEDPEIFNIAVKFNAPIILMHKKGKTDNMQEAPFYNNIIQEVKHYFTEKIQILEQKKFRKIIVDPGFGFGKNLEHNYILLKYLSSISELNYPLLAGISRKSMINKITGTIPENALNGTTVANTIALQNGASILRVHDVKEAIEAIKIVNYIKSV